MSPAATAVTCVFVTSSTAAPDALIVFLPVQLHCLKTVPAATEVRISLPFSWAPVQARDRYKLVRIELEGVDSSWAEWSGVEV